MAALIAGWVAGYAMALLSTAALTYVFTRRRFAVAQRWLGEGTNPALIAVPVSIGTFVAWTMAGLVIAVIYEEAGLASQPGLFGSPSAPFLAGVSVIAIMPLPLLTLLWRDQWWLWTGMSAAFLGLFGWLMPLLAEQ
ncbi:MAG: hypothetical protein ACKVT1_10585 [Dehalococcoidia bacterium]